MDKRILGSKGSTHSSHLKGKYCRPDKAAQTTDHSSGSICPARNFGMWTWTWPKTPAKMFQPDKGWVLGQGSGSSCRKDTAAQMEDHCEGSSCLARNFGMWYWIWPKTSAKMIQPDKGWVLGPGWGSSCRRDTAAQMKDH